MSGYVWWVALHDGESHAIARSQAAGADDGTVDTECGEVLAISESEHSPNGRFCQKCLAATGEGAPDHSWR